MSSKYWRGFIKSFQGSRLVAVVVTPKVTLSAFLVAVRVVRALCHFPVAVQSKYAILCCVRDDSFGWRRCCWHILVVSLDGPNKASTNTGKQVPRVFLYYKHIDKKTSLYLSTFCIIPCTGCTTAGSNEQDRDVGAAARFQWCRHWEHCRDSTFRSPIFPSRRR